MNSPPRPRWNRQLPVWLGVLASTVVLGAADCGFAQNAGNVYLFPYFTGNGDPNSGDGGLYLSCSTNGVNFTSLNDGLPIFAPNQPLTLMPVGQQLVRDASIIYHNGLFDMVWTSNWGGNVFGFAQSTDMVHWTNVHAIQPFASSVTVQNVWAPSIAWNPVNNNYFIVFSSALTPADYNNDNMRMYDVTSTNLTAFSTALTTPFYDSGSSEIDGQMTYDSANNRWILVYKNEASGQKNLNLAFIAGNLQGSWTPYTYNPIIGPVSSYTTGLLAEAAEGPILVNNGSGYNLYFDNFENGDFGEASTTSPLAPTVAQVWTADAMTNPVADPRHGTIFVAPAASVGFLNGTDLWNGNGDFAANSANWSLQYSPTGGMAAYVNSGTLTISGTTGYSGGTFLNAGTVTVSGSATLGGNVSGNNIQLYGGVLSLAGSANIGAKQDIIFAGGALQYTAASAAAGAADYSPQIKNSTSPITIDTNGQGVTWAGSLDSSNTGGLTKIGNGTLTLAAANNYSGVTTLSAGTLVAGNLQAFGANAAAAALSLGGGALDLRTDTSISPYNTTVAGTATVLSDRATPGAPASRRPWATCPSAPARSPSTRGPTSPAAPAVSFGTATLSGAATINTNAGVGTALAAVAGGGNALTIGGAGNTTIAGNAVSGSLTKTGTGTLTLTGSVAVTGGAYPRAGELLLSNGTLATTAYSSFGLAAGDTATVVAQGNSRIAVNGDFNVSDQAGSSGTMTLMGNSTAQGVNTYIGKTSAIGVLTVQNSAALAATGYLYVGDTGSAAGTLNVRNSAGVAVTGVLKPRQFRQQRGHPQSQRRDDHGRRRRFPRRRL